MIKQLLKKHTYEVVFAVLAVLILVLIFVLYGKTNAVHGEVDKVYAAVNAMAENEGTVFDDALFVVREKEGKVAIFDYRTGKVIEELNVYTYSLPQTDRTYLEKGIMLYTVSDLISLIEDYTG